MTARGIVQRGLRASSPSGAAASKPMKARIPKTIPLKIAGEVARRVGFTFSGLNACEVQLVGVRDEHPDRQRAEDRDLERAEDDARLGREANVAVGEEEDDRRGDEHPRPPADVPADLVLHHVLGRPGEDQEEQRRHERLEEEERPAGQEADVRPERPALYV